MPRDSCLRVTLEMGGNALEYRFPGRPSPSGLVPRTLHLRRTMGSLGAPRFENHSSDRRVSCVRRGLTARPCERPPSTEAAGPFSAGLTCAHVHNLTQPPSPRGCVSPGPTRRGTPDGKELPQGLCTRAREGTGPGPPARVLPAGGPAPVSTCAAAGAPVPPHFPLNPVICAAY